MTKLFIKIYIYFCYWVKYIENTETPEEPSYINEFKLQKKRTKKDEFFRCTGRTPTPEDLIGEVLRVERLSREYVFPYLIGHDFYLNKS